MLPSLAPCHVCAFVHSKRRYFLERRLDMMRGRAGITILNQRVLARLLAVCDPPPAPATVTPTPGPAAARRGRPSDTVVRVATGARDSGLSTIAAAFSVSIAVLDVDHPRNCADWFYHTL